MMHPSARRKLCRRKFLQGTAAGLGIGVPAGLLGVKYLPEAIRHLYQSSDVRVEAPHKARVDRLPGSFRGRVVEVENPHAVLPQIEDGQHVIDRTVVRRMLDQGMCEFVGCEHASEAWGHFFTKGEVIGIKVNPVGTNRNADATDPKSARRREGVVGSVSSPAVLLEIVRNLKAIGVRAKDIVVFERYANEFIAAGYEEVLREPEMDGVRWCAASAGYSDTQLEIDGVYNRNAYSSELLKHVVGYDPDSFVHMGFAAPEQSGNDERRFRSHLTTIITRMVDKFITIPVLKDHRSSGITIALKNLSHGLNNNVARSHISPMAHGYPASPGRALDGPNQCNVFIPTAVNQPLIREKATLHIVDGLVGVYEGGPGVWNSSWGTWRANKIFVATDPVAMDHIGWDIIDSKRVQLGLARVGEIGRRDFTPTKQTQMTLARMGSANPLDALTKAVASDFVRDAGRTEIFDRRTPEHIILASMIGLGEFELNKITYKKFLQA